MFTSLKWGCNCYKDQMKCCMWGDVVSEAPGDLLKCRFHSRKSDGACRGLRNPHFNRGPAHSEQAEGDLRHLGPTLSCDLLPGSMIRGWWEKGRLLSKLANSSKHPSTQPKPRSIQQTSQSDSVAQITGRLLSFVSFFFFSCHLT